jgi:hypothetical protein
VLYKLILISLDKVVEIPYAMKMSYNNYLLSHKVLEACKCLTCGPIINPVFLKYLMNTEYLISSSSAVLDSILRNLDHFV